MRGPSPQTSLTSEVLFYLDFSIENLITYRPKDRYSDRAMTYHTNTKLRFTWKSVEKTKSINERQMIVSEDNQYFQVMFSRRWDACWGKQTLTFIIMHSRGSYKEPSLNNNGHQKSWSVVFSFTIASVESLSPSLNE